MSDWLRLLQTIFQPWNPWNGVQISVQILISKVFYYCSYWQVTIDICNTRLAMFFTIQNSSNIYLLLPWKLSKYRHDSVRNCSWCANWCGCSGTNEIIKLCKTWIRCTTGGNYCSWWCWYHTYINADVMLPTLFGFLICLISTVLCIFLKYELYDVFLDI